MSFISFIRSEAKFYNEFYEVLQVLHVLLGFVWRAQFLAPSKFFRFICAQFCLFYV